MLPPIPTVNFVEINEGYPMQVDDGLLAPKLILPISEVIVTPTAQQVIQVTLGAPIKDRGNEITFDEIILMKPL